MQRLRLGDVMPEGSLEAEHGLQKRCQSIVTIFRLRGLFRVGPYDEPPRGRCMTARHDQEDSSGLPTLEALMRRGQAGEAEAYRLLLSEVAVRMRRLVRRRAPWLTAEDVEDLVQDILLSLHQARGTWDPARPFLPWIVAIARARLADNARRYTRRKAIDMAVSDLAETFCDIPTNSNVETVVNLLSVRKAMKGLSPAEKQAVELLRLREMSLKEAAEASGSTVAALKVAMHRAMRKMKATLWKD
jgi:RNA polymerase sigma factor (sigma-70 family)